MISETGIIPRLNPAKWRIIVAFLLSAELYPNVVEAETILNCRVHSVVTEAGRITASKDEEVVFRIDDNAIYRWFPGSGAIAAEWGQLCGSGNSDCEMTDTQFGYDFASKAAAPDGKPNSSGDLEINRISGVVAETGSYFAKDMNARVSLQINGTCAPGQAPMQPKAQF